MRTIAEVRDAKLAEVRFVVSRGLWGADGRSMQTFMQGLLNDLTFIDDRDDERTNVCDRLDRYGKLGVAGAFEAVFGDDFDYGPEVVSVFAEMLAELGYLETDRLLSEFEWRALTSSLRDRYEEVDVRRSQVIDDLGAPSFAINNRVACYTSDAAQGWVCFDFWEAPVTKYVEAHDSMRGNFLTEREPDPLLRNIRVPAASFNESLIMTTYGKVLRWGPGWWLQSVPARAGNTPNGVREQLQGINAGDPSQSLGLRRP